MLSGLAIVCAPRRTLDGVAMAGALVSAAAAVALSAVALAAPASALVEKWVVVDAAGGTARRGDRRCRRRQRARLTRLSGDPVGERPRAARAAAAHVLLPALRFLGDPGRGPARRQPRRRLAARRGDDRRLGAARRLQRQAARARGRLEVPDPHLARPRRRAARDRPPRGGRRTRRPRRALLATSSPTSAPGTAPHWSPTCCCSPGWPRRSAGRRCTTGFPTRTRRRPRRSRRCSRRRSCRRCCSSPGARARRSARSIGASTARSVLVGFGLLSLAVAVPFLWRPLPWKRLLAYSSLEHMGVIALGIGFGTPLALAGVAVHIAGHALAKALGFYAATPLLGARAARGRPRRHAASRARSPRSAPRSGISLGALAGLPPSPLFVSEVLIVAGGFAAGRPWTCRRRRGPARARLPRPRARADRDDRRQGAPRRDRSAPGLRGVVAADERRGSLPARRSPLRRSGCRAARSRARSSRGSDDRRVAARPPRARRGSGASPASTRRPTERRAHAARRAGRRARGSRPSRSRTGGPDDRRPRRRPPAGTSARPHDLYGVELRRPRAAAAARRPRPRPSPLDRARCTGDDAYQVAVGPIHAGVIESGHFRFHVVGDRILHLDARLFYKHRGLERAAEGRTLEEGLAYAQRACAACAVSNSVAYAHACEQSARPASRRTSSLASARSCSSSSASGATSTTSPPSAPASASPPATPSSPHSPSARDGSTQRSPATASCSAPSRSAAAGSPSTARRVAAARDELAAIAAESTSGWRELLFNASFQDRLPDVGVVTPTTRTRLGAVGPAARAAGLPDDARTTADGLAYDGLRSRSRRDASRVTCRRGSSSAPLELLQTFDLLDSSARPTARARRAREPGEPDSRSASAGSRARAAPPPASSSGPAAASSACTSAPARTPTGRSSPTPQPATCSPTSR